MLGNVSNRMCCVCSLRPIPITELLLQGHAQLKAERGTTYGEELTTIRLLDITHIIVA